MLGFHRRTRSLIPVKSLTKYDKLEEKVEVEELYGEEELDCGFDAGLDAEIRELEDKQRRRRLMIVYVIYLAEAIMASSLQPQLKMLLENDDFCGNLSSSFLRSILECAYAFGCTSGIFWGYLADRLGRRPIALGSLIGMSAFCLSMGFATDLLSCALFRFGAGVVSSAIVVVCLTMIGDLSRDPMERASNVARLPIISVFGATGPVVQGIIAKGVERSGELWQRFPTLSGQIACASVVFVIGIFACIMLEETLPNETKPVGTLDIDCEKAAFLGQSLSDGGLQSPTVRIVDFERPEPISLNQFMQAPSLLVLLASFSLLALHSSTFDVLLPHLGHSRAQHGGMGLPCDWLGLLVLGMKLLAALLIVHFVPRLVASRGLLKPYRTCSVVFPVLYAATPVLAYLFPSSAIFTTIVSTVAILVKHILASGAGVLVSLLVLAAAPDAFSTGSVIGLMQISSLFRALAVAVSGASFYLSTDYSIAMTNCGMWAILAALSLSGAALAWFVREGTRVEGDFPSEVLKWELAFDVESVEEL